MKHFLKRPLAALCGLALLAGPAAALRNPALLQQGDLPRDQYLDLVNPDQVLLDKLLVKFDEDTRVRLRDGRLVSLEGGDLAPLEAFLKAHPRLRLSRVYDTVGEEELDAYVARGERLSGIDLPDLNNWYLLSLDGRNGDPAGLLKELLAIKQVQTAYYEPLAAPATCGVDPAPTTPDYVSQQDYRDPAPTGVDIQYAWDHDPSHGNGISTWYFQDLEWGWCEAHEDYALLDIRNGADSTEPDYYNHGTAVMGIIGACDDGKGVAGLVPEVRLTARVVSNHSSTAAALIAIGADLLTGEMYLIEMHAQGPDQGTTCLCNCGQFRYIAMEYWQANFDAILANSANGRTCVEASGNGSMDLDWAGYGGAFNRSVRDSQAILVGAGTSGSVHNPMCYTSHGSRIDAYGWGENVMTTGYGATFNPAGCDQDYTAYFAGTSSAAPIVAGAAASLALIHRNQEGSYASPLTLRTRLTEAGTPQGPSDPSKEIGVLPNLHAILAPDLAPIQPAGWSGCIVPSDVTGTNTVSATLPAYPAPTYLDLAVMNWSRYSDLGSSSFSTYQDDRQLSWTTLFSHPPYTLRMVLDRDEHVRGGRHYLKIVADPADHLDESNEDNNRHIAVFCWNAMPLGSDVPLVSYCGPKRNPEGVVYAALDGYSNGGSFGSFWDVFGVMPDGSSDYDIRLFNSTPTATTGWSTSVATSAGITTVDFVGANNNVVTDGDYVGVVRYSESCEDYYVEGQGSYYLGAPTSNLVSLTGQAVSSGEILEVYEFNVTSLAPIVFHLDLTGAMADLVGCVFGPSSTYFARSNAQWTLNSGGAGADELGIFQPAATGYHCLVVCKNLATELYNSGNYSLRWGLANGDLTTVARAGWTAPVVARNSGGSTGVLPAQLHEGASLGDAGVANIGVGAVPAGANMAFTLDGPVIFSSGNFTSLIPGYEGEIAGRSLGSIVGGRHELGAIQDHLSEIAEEPPAGENNNRWYGQYAWTPHQLAAEVPELRGPAPNWRNADNPGSWSHPNYNQDGYRFQCVFWAGLAAMPANGTTTLDMHGYDYSSTNPMTALTGPAAHDIPPAGGISFVMTNGSVLGHNSWHDAGVFNNLTWPSGASTTNYTIHAAGYSGDLFPGVAVNGVLQSVAGTGGQLMACYDMYIQAGATLPVNLSNLSNVDLGVAVFQAGLDVVAKVDALIDINAPGDGFNELGSFTAPVSGWYGVVVYRSNHTDLGPAAPYRLTVGSRQPMAITDLVLTPVETDAGDGVLHFNFQFSDVTTDIDGTPVVVDRYYYYWANQPYAPFPDGWNLLGQTYVSQWDNVPINVSSVQRYFFLVTAVDDNGRIVAGSQAIPAVLNETPDRQE